MKPRSLLTNEYPSIADHNNSFGCGNGSGQNFRGNLPADIVLSSNPRINGANGAPCYGNGRAAPSRNTSKKFKRRSFRSGSKNDTDLSSLIASELTKSSREDRTKALEEVHGVVERSEEDPDEINRLFDQVKEELKRIRYKQAYERAAFLSSTYVSAPEFVLTFLRSDNYNPRPAAIRLSEHFKYKLELFGEHTLVRDIMYDDLDDVEKTILHSGFVQTCFASDRSGRQIVVCNMSEFLKTGNLKNVLRVTWYLSVRNAQMNTAISKMGIVGVYFAHGMGNIFEKLRKDISELTEGTDFLLNALPFKLASVHFCFDNTLGSYIQTHVMMSLGKFARLRLRSHCGSRMECCYALKSFGIDMDPFDTNETSLSDSVTKMIQECRAIDDKERKKSEARLLPRPNDVLLGRGRPFQLFPGNLALANKIDNNRARYSLAKKMDKKFITSEVVASIRESGGRFLKKVNNENGSGADWEEVDFETSRLKVSHSFRTMSRWQTDNDEAWKKTGKGGEDLLNNSISFTMGGEHNPIGPPLNAASLPVGMNMNLAFSNNMRNG